MLGDLLTTLSFAIPVPLMQAQQYSIPPHSCYYHAAPNTYPTVPEQYTASNVGDFTSFSRGSSLVYPQDYQYFSHRGLSSRHSSSNFINTQSIDATVSGLAGNSTAGTDMNYRPEDVMAYQPSWRWTNSSIPEASVPMVPAVYSGAEREKSSLDYTFVTTPTTAVSLPTPAAMADMMNRSLQLDVGHQQVSFQMPSSQSVAQVSATVAKASRTEPAGQRLHSVPDTQSREKKHACSMCHKRFDRPSTLRKHLLVHTGEKAFVCDTCGRRFGVASNLNRHVRRCILKPIHAASATSPSDSTSGSAQSVSPVPSNGSQTQMGSLNGQGNKRIKTRALSSDQFNISAGLESQPSERHADVKPLMPKRKRRAPSPSQWVPCSLSHFNLASEELDKVTPVPLPPVRRCLPREERDSWDENINATPYHPRGWKNVLPGPGLGICSGFGGKDVRNLNIGGDSGYMLGRVLVF